MLLTCLLIFSYSYKVDQGIQLEKSCEFKKINLTPYERITLNTEGKDVLIMDTHQNEFKIFLDEDGKNQNDQNEIGSSILASSGNLFINGDKIDIKSMSNKTITVYLWLIPKGLCNSSAVLKTDYKIIVNAYDKDFTGSVCLFSQNTFRKAFFSTYIQQDRRNTLVSMFGSEESLAPKQYCHHKTCKFHENKPFFVLIKSLKMSKLSLNLRYGVSNKGNKTMQCSFLPVVNYQNNQDIIRKFGKLETDGNIDAIKRMIINKPFEEINIFCETKLHEAIRNLKFLLVLVASLIAFALILSCTGAMKCVDIVFPDQERRRFENLRADPYASTIEESMINHELDENVPKIEEEA